MTDDVFEKPKRVKVDALGYLSNALKNGLTKDLQENQILCVTCKGTGLAITNQVYGLKNDPDKSRNFPYNNQYIVSCTDCYSGIIKLCEHCRSEFPRYTSWCNCDKAKSIRYSKEIAKENELLSKAIKLKYDDERSLAMGMHYYDDYPYNGGYFDCFDEFLDWWNDEYLDEDVSKPKYVWGTYEINLSLDAENILESACDDLHEEAGSNLTQVKELQEFLDKWCERQSGTTTYYQDIKYAIEIPW